MKRLLTVLMFAMLLTGQAFASTYYIAASGGSDSNPGTTGSRWATFAHAFSVMTHNDTLIVGNGTYTEDITLNGATGLNGTSGAYTTIQAENTWGATVDGSAVTPAYGSTLFMYGASYMQVIGIKFASGPALTGEQNPITVSASNHIKLEKLAGYNAPCTGNTAVFVVTAASSYVLIENSHAWGCGRYKFLSYQSSNVIFRHNVARHDDHQGMWANQCAQFIMYDSTNVLMQNDIAIDSGEMDASTGNLYGGIWSENNASVDNSGKYEGDIFLNLKTGLQGASINDPKLIGTREISNVAIINSIAGFWGDRIDGTALPASLLLHHMTFANITGSNPGSGNSADGVGATEMNNGNFTAKIIKDSVLQHDNSFGIAEFMASDNTVSYTHLTLPTI